MLKPIKLGICVFAACVAALQAGAQQPTATDLANAYWSLRSYRAESVESGLLPDRPQQKLLRRITYAHPLRVRIETLAPADRRGDLVIFDGLSTTYWWPAEKRGLRIVNAHAPDEAAFRAYLGRMYALAMNDYTWSYQEDQQLLGRAVQYWKVLPNGDDPYDFPHDEWRDKQYQLPLKITVDDAQGQPWYGFEMTKFDDSPAVAAKDFAFQFPAGAEVTEFDLLAPAIGADEARSIVGARLRTPAFLPAGHRVEKIIRSRSGRPTALVLMSAGAEWLTLAESRYAGAVPYRLPVGKPVLVRGKPAYLNFIGPNNLLRWVDGGVEYSLFGNLPTATLMRTAESLQ